MSCGIDARGGWIVSISINTSMIGLILCFYSLISVCIPLNCVKLLLLFLRGNENTAQTCTMRNVFLFPLSRIFYL